MDQQTPNVAQTPTQQQAQPPRITVEQIIVQLLNTTNILSLQLDTLYEFVCDTDEKKAKFKGIFEKKQNDYLEKVKSAQFKQKIMAK